MIQNFAAFDKFLYQKEISLLKTLTRPIEISFPRSDGLISMLNESELKYQPNPNKMEMT